MKYAINIFFTVSILKIFYSHDFENCFSRVVEAFKVWAFEGITAGKTFSKCILEAKTSLKQFNIVLEGKYGTCRAF